MNTENSPETWSSAWPDALALTVGLAVAWWARWDAGDLVWSLWLSSLVVGYSIIVWTIAHPAVEMGRGAWKARKLTVSHPNALLTFWSILVLGVVVAIGFFTVHFGMFHYIHSQLMISFFPIDTGGAAGNATDAGMSTYVEIMRRYWTFLPAAFLAERAAFMRKPLSLELDLSHAGPASKSGKPARIQSLIWAPYRSVARMHMLIFFFFFAHFARLENFAVYAVVYAVYFFPWRLVRRPVAQPTPA
jgi:uncharacterized protein DUF6498